MYNPAMALNRPALVDALTDAGLEAEAVRRVVDMLEQSYADTAQQTEMNLRFSALEKNLADHDRLNETQSKSLGDRLQDFKEELERRVVDLKEVMDREFAAVRNELGTEIAAVRSEIASVRNELGTEIASLRNELGTEIAAVRNEMRTEFAAVRNELRTEFAAVRNEMRTEFAAVRGEIASLRSEMTMMRWVVGGLFVMNATTLGIVIERLF